MCLKRSVGVSGRNDLMDVAIVQLLLNLNLPRFKDPKPATLKTDGRIGSKSLKTIAACWFWNTRDLNKLADQDDVRAITRRIDGGFNGIDDRVDFLMGGMAVFGLS